jgi:RNA recognition motif-containing protein
LPLGSGGGWAPVRPGRAVPLMNLSTVFVGNIPFDANENSIREVFKIIGPVRTFW